MSALNKHQRAARHARTRNNYFELFRGRERQVLPACARARLTKALHQIFEARR